MVVCGGGDQSRAMRGGVFCYARIELGTQSGSVGSSDGSGVSMTWRECTHGSGGGSNVKLARK